MENKLNHLGKSNIGLDSLEEDQKEFIKYNNIILKTQQRFRSENHNIFTEKINKTALSLTAN